MATIILQIDTDLEEDVQGLVAVIEAAAGLLTSESIVRSHMTDHAVFRSDVVRAAGMLWSGDAPHGEYLRGQVETIADAFGWDNTVSFDMPKDEIAAEISEVWRG